MSLIAPAFLALAALAIPIILLYMLRLRRREITVSSTMLWQMVLRDREANAPWQRLRRNLLLLLQLLLLLLLVLALSRPFWPVPVVASGQVIVLLDASVSMQATDVQPSRFAVAQAAVRELIYGLADDSRMTLIVVAAQPDVLLADERDPARLRAALDDLQPTFGPADWQGALALAAGAAGSTDNVTTVLISDGGLPANLPSLPGEVRYVPVGVAADNVGIAAMSVRAAPDGPQLFVSATNYGTTAANPVLTVSLEGDFLLLAEQLDIPPGDTVSQVFDLPVGSGLVTAYLSRPAVNPTPDYLAGDDYAYKVYDPPQAGRVLLVTEQGNLFVEQVLAALPGVQAFRTDPGTLPDDPFDLYIFDRVWPAELPDQEILFIAPPDNPIAPVTGTYSPDATTSLSVAADSPLNAFVDWNAVSFLEVSAITPPPWADVHVLMDGQFPLLMSGTFEGRRVAFLGFSPRNSDMPLQVGWPILFANLIDWLTPATVIESDADVVRIGDPVTILPDVGVIGVAVRDPAGQVYSATVGEAGALFAATRLPGIYTVSDNNSVVGAFAVNLFDPAESTIAPQPTLSIGQAPLDAAARDEIGQRELWPWLAALALAVLLIEWWVYHRRSTLPAAPSLLGWLRRRQVGRTK